MPRYPRYAVSEDVSIDNEENHARLLSADNARANAPEDKGNQVKDAQRARAASKVKTWMEYKIGLDMEIAGHEKTSQEFYAEHRDELHGEALNITADQGVNIVRRDNVAAPQAAGNVIQFPRAAASGHVPAETVPVAAAK